MFASLKLSSVFEAVKEVLCSEFIQCVALPGIKYCPLKETIGSIGNCADQPPSLLQFWQNLVSIGTGTTGRYARSSELCCSTSKLPLRPEPKPYGQFDFLNNSATFIPEREDWICGVPVYQREL